MLAIKNLTLNVWQEQENVIQGWNINKAIDGTLDYAVVKYISTGANGHSIYSPALLSKDTIALASIESLTPVSKTYQFFIVMSDTCDTQKRLSNTKYMHTLVLVEPTKYLERIVCPPDAFTYREIGTIKDQVEKCLINAETLIAYSSPRFYLNNVTSILLNNAESEEFYFSGANTLKERLDIFLKEINSRAYVPKLTNLDAIEIYHYDMSKLNAKIEMAEDIFNTNTKIEIETAADRIVSFGKNALNSRANTIIHGWDTLKPNKLETLTTSNATIQLQLPIEKLVKFEFKTEFRITKSSDLSLIGTDDYVIDLTDYFLEEELYQLLKISDQELMLYYTRGSDNISSVTKTYNKLIGLLTNTTLESVINDFLLSYDFESNPVGFDYGGVTWSDISVVRNKSGINLVSESAFKMEYIPFIDFHMDSTKPTATNQYTTAMIDNQQEEIIDVFAYGNSLQEKAKRIGNQETNKDLVIYDLNNLNDLGDYLETGEVITNISYSVYNNFIKVRYTLSQDYSNMYQDIALDRRKTLYKIPLESIKTDVLFKNIVNISTEAPVDPEIKGLGHWGLIQLIGTLTNTYRLDKAVKGFLTEVKQFGNLNPDYADNYYFLYTANFAGGNSLYFRMSMLDNLNAGLSASFDYAEVGGKKIIMNPYCDSNGIFDDLDFYLTSDIEGVDSVAEYAILPKVLKTNVTSTDLLTEELTITRYKDRAVTIAMTYQVELMAKPNVIIGRKFIEKNLLAFADEAPTMRVYEVATKYTNNQVFYTRGTPNASITFSVAVTDGVGILTLSETPTSYWAIGDTSGNLYLAVNEENCNKIYFTPSYKVI